jgi:hypothetical protein
MTPSEIKPAPFQLVAQCLNQLCHHVSPCTFYTFSEFCSANPTVPLSPNTYYKALFQFNYHFALCSCCLCTFSYPSTLYLPYLDPVPLLLCFSGMYPAWHIVGNLVLTCIFKFGFGVTVQGMPVSLQGVVLIWSCFVQFGFIIYENGAAVAGICMLRDYCHYVSKSRIFGDY